MTLVLKLVIIKFFKLLTDMTRNLKINVFLYFLIKGYNVYILVN